MRWLGHVFRMEPDRRGPDRTAKIALRWTPPGKRKPGRPRTTWRRTITTELAENHLTLGERKTGLGIGCGGNSLWRPYAPQGAKRSSSSRNP